jgi:adenosylhomocysteinase
MDNTNLIIAAKTVVVAGYGWCSRGIAMRAAALGANVIVTEINPVKAIEARMDGFQVMTMEKAAPLGDIFVSATGCCKTIAVKHMLMMKDGALLSNAGHFNVEVDVAALEREAVKKEEQRHNIMGYTLKNGKTLSLLGEGRLVNLACGDGHPAEIMDMSFAVQALSAEYLVKHKDDSLPMINQVPEEIDNEIARRKLASMNVSIDTLTEVQEQYRNSFDL